MRLHPPTNPSRRTHTLRLLALTATLTTAAWALLAYLLHHTTTASTPDGISQTALLATTLPPLLYETLTTPLLALLSYKRLLPPPALVCAAVVAMLVWAVSGVANIAVVVLSGDQLELEDGPAEATATATATVEQVSQALAGLQCGIALVWMYGTWGAANWVREEKRAAKRAAKRGGPGCD